MHATNIWAPTLLPTDRSEVLRNSPDKCERAVVIGGASVDANADHRSAC